MAAADTTGTTNTFQSTLSTWGEDLTALLGTYSSIDYAYQSTQNSGQGTNLSVGGVQPGAGISTGSLVMIAAIGLVGALVLRKLLK